MLLSTYSHSSFLHLAANMMGLWSFSPRLMAWRASSQQAPRLTPSEFLALYTGAGVSASLASNLFMRSLGQPRPALGASGAIFAVLTYYSLSLPDSRVLFLFVFNMSSLDALLGATAVNALLCAQEVRAARLGRAGPLFDGMAHLAGSAVGAAAYYAARARARSRGEPERARAGGDGGFGGAELEVRWRSRSSDDRGGDPWAPPRSGRETDL